MSLPILELLCRNIFKPTALLIVVMLWMNTVIAQTIDLNRPVGMTESSAGSYGGAATYTIPIEVPA